MDYTLPKKSPDTIGCHVEPLFVSVFGKRVLKVQGGLGENEKGVELQSKWKLCAVGFMQLSLERVVILTWGLQESV